MYLRRKLKVPQFNCLFAIYLTSAALLIGQVLCSDNVVDSHASNLKKMPERGSGSGMSASTLQKRSSYAVMQQAMQSYAENEFGSEYEGDWENKISTISIFKLA
jgi:hypothetical protein